MAPDGRLGRWIWTGAVLGWAGVFSQRSVAVHLIRYCTCWHSLHVANELVLCTSIAIPCPNHEEAFRPTQAKSNQSNRSIKRHRGQWRSTPLETRFQIVHRRNSLYSPQSTSNMPRNSNSRTFISINPSQPHHHHNAQRDPPRPKRNVGRSSHPRTMLRYADSIKHRVLPVTLPTDHYPQAHHLQSPVPIVSDRPPPSASLPSRWFRRPREINRPQIATSPSKHTSCARRQQQQMPPSPLVSCVHWTRPGTNCQSWSTRNGQSFPLAIPILGIAIAKGSIRTRKTSGLFGIGTRKRRGRGRNRRTAIRKDQETRTARAKAKTSSRE